MTLTFVRMPKWGLSMEEGTVVAWLKQPGEQVGEGDELLEIETSKITNVLEATQPGVLARIMAQPGDVIVVGCPIAVLSEGDASDAELDAFVANAPATVISDEQSNDATLVLQQVDIGGRHLNVGTVGAGPPIVLLHGLSGDLGNWLFNIDALRAHGQVIAIDLPGHGASSKDVGDGSLQALAAAVAQALDALGVPAARFVGHSLGAAVAAQLSLDRPGMVTSLAMICPPGLPGTIVSAEFVSGIVTAQRPREVKAVLQRLVADPNAIGADMVEGMLRYKRLDGAQAALGILRDRLLGGDDLHMLGASLSQMPAAFVIASQADQVVGAPDASQLPPGWTILWVEGAGHMPHLEKAAEVNAALLQHLTA